MSEYLHKTIHETIEELNVRYFLPDIQRPFVWDPEQITALFDSLMRLYPISTFLFWKIEKETIDKYNIKKLKFVLNSESENEEDRTLNRDEYFLVLDGQQRLTALNLALKGDYTIRNKKKDLFFDLLSGVDENSNGELYHFTFDKFDSNGLEYEKERDDKDGTHFPPALWVRVKKIYGLITPQGPYKEKLRFVEEIKSKFTRLTEDEFTRMQENIDKLINALGYEKKITYFEEKEKDYNRVLDIFIRTNAGGTKLSYSDLLFSKIKLKWPVAREKFSELLDSLNQSDFGFDHDFLLKSFLVAFSADSNEVRFRVENFKDEKINRIETEWEKLSAAHLLTADLLNIFNITDKKLLPSKNAVIPIFYYIYQNDLKRIGNYKGNNISEEKTQQIQKWLLKILLTKTFGGQSDNLLYKTKKCIAEQKEFNILELNKVIQETGKSLDITSDFLYKIKYNSTDSYLLLSLLYNQLNFKPRLVSNIPQQDHIFSQKELRGKYVPKEINSIFNIRYVTADENNWKKDTPFSEFIKTLTGAKKKEHFIPEGEWGVDKYKEFLAARKNLVWDFIKGKLD